MEFAVCQSCYYDSFIWTCCWQVSFISTFDWNGLLIYMIEKDFHCRKLHKFSKRSLEIVSIGTVVLYSKYNLIYYIYVFESVLWTVMQATCWGQEIIEPSNLWLECIAWNLLKYTWNDQKGILYFTIDSSHDTLLHNSYFSSYYLVFASPVRFKYFHQIPDPHNYMLLFDAAHFLFFCSALRNMHQSVCHDLFVNVI